MKYLVISISLLLCCVYSLRAQSAFEVGSKAPNFTVGMLEGGQFKLSKYRGRVVLLSFWATWCKPCLKEMDEMPEKILRRFEDKKVTTIAISKGEPRVTVEKKSRELEERGVVLPVGLDPYDKIGRMLGDDRLPQLILIDTKGIVRYHEIGYTPQRLDEVARLIDELLKD